MAEAIRAITRAELGSAREHVDGFVDVEVRSIDAARGVARKRVRWRIVGVFARVDAWRWMHGVEWIT